MLKSHWPEAESRRMNSKTTLSLGLFVVLNFCDGAQAEVLHWAQPCLKGELVLSNATSSSRKAWLQKFTKALIEETEFTLYGSETVRIPLNKMSELDHFSLLHFEPENTLQMKVVCDNKIYSVNSLEGGVLTFNRGTQLSLQNLYTDVNTIQVEELNTQGEVLFTTPIELLSRASQTFTPHLQARQIRVSGTHRYSAFSLNTEGGEGPILVQPQKIAENFEGIFFEVGPRTGSGDTFIVQIKDPKLIQKARDQISNPKLEKIVFAQVQKGASTFNRNRSRIDKSFWSWFASEVTNISDIGSTTCNGLPQFLEDRIDQWIKDPGRICFWTYRIKRELSGHDIANGL